MSGTARGAADRGTSALIDAMQDGLLATGDDGSIVRVSPSFCRMTGFREEELLGANRPYPFWPEEALEEISAASRRFRSAGVQEFDLTFRHKDGRRIPVIISAALIDGGPGGVAVVKDVTRRRAREQDRAEALADLARAQRIARLGSYALELGSGVITWSEQMFRIFGIPPTPDRTVPAERLLELTHPGDRERLAAAVDAARRRGGVMPRLEHRIVRPDGGVRTVVAEQGDVERDPVSGRVRLVGTVLDITDLRAAEEQVARLAEQRGKLVADALDAEDRARQRIAEALHDDVLQDLLAARQDLAEALEEAPRESVVRAREGLVRATVMLREAVAELHPVTLSHGGLGAAVKAVADRAARRGGFVCDLDVTPAGAGVHDRVVLGLVRELLENAAKHAAASRVRVRVSRQGGEIRILVEDDGVGIPAERLDAALAEGHIGLAAARERVRALDGALTVGASPAGGARVEAALPLRRAEPPAP
ncbi:MAG TPA: PAS domain S-box protein [Miltoncostaeaceae bacterium]|nr:PAS domain S-box protein [Miltoncostaeaceae bacterium]